jgi:hypothetical protein
VERVQEFVRDDLLPTFIPLTNEMSVDGLARRREKKTFVSLLKTAYQLKKGRTRVGSP